MCDYCGCRRQPAISELSEEHDRLLDHLYALRSDAHAGDRAAVVLRLESEVLPLLRHHAGKEEQGVFAQLRRVGVEGRVDALEGEHRTLDAAAADALTAGDDWVAAVERLSAELSQHILDEETDLFPYASYELAAAAWDEVEAVHAAAADAAPTAVTSGRATTGRPRQPVG